MDIGTAAIIWWYIDGLFIQFVILRMLSNGIEDNLVQIYDVGTRCCCWLFLLSSKDVDKVVAGILLPLSIKYSYCYIYFSAATTAVFFL